MARPGGAPLRGALDSGGGRQPPRPAFFEHVADEVGWMVMGFHRRPPRAAAAFREGAFSRLAEVLLSPALSGERAVAELESGAWACNGMNFNNRYFWLRRFDAERIVEVRACLHTALVQRLFDENRR